MRGRSWTEPRGYSFYRFLRYHQLIRSGTGVRRRPGRRDEPDTDNIWSPVRSSGPPSSHQNLQIASDTPATTVIMFSDHSLGPRTRGKAHLVNREVHRAD